MNLITTKSAEQKVGVAASVSSPTGGGADRGPAEGVPDAMGASLSEMMGDAPLCETCGHITVRNGSCYRCLNCGNSMGCS